MKNIITLFVLTTTLSLSAISCCKSTPDVPGPTPGEDEPTVVPVICKEHSLVHHDAVLPTASTSGNVEYYKCSKCGRCFEDVHGKIPIVNSPFLRSSNRSIDPAVLGYKRNVFVRKGVTPTKGAVVEAIDAGLSIVSSVLGIACSIVDLVSEDEETNTEEYFNEIMAGIDGISQSVSDVNSRTKMILGYLEEEPYRNYIDDTNNELDFLWKYTKQTYSAIKEMLGWYHKGYLSKDEFQTEVKYVLMDWAGREYNGSKLPDLFTRKLNEYNSCSIDGQKQTFPQITRTYSQSYSVFDHQAYPDRAGLNRYAEFILASAYYLDGMCRTSGVIEYHSQYIRMQDSLEFRSLYENMDLIVKADSSNMQNAYANYRVFRDCSNENVVVMKNKACGGHDYYKWLQSNKGTENNYKAFLPGDNYNGKLLETLDRMMSECIGIQNPGNLLSQSEMELMFNEYNPYTSSSLISIYSIIRDTAEVSGFKGYEEEVKVSSGTAKNYAFFWRDYESLEYGSKTYYDSSKDYAPESNDHYDIIYYYGHGSNSSYSKLAVETCVDNSCQMCMVYINQKIFEETSWYKKGDGRAEWNENNYGGLRGTDDQYASDKKLTCYTSVEKYTGTMYE